LPVCQQCENGVVECGDEGTLCGRPTTTAGTPRFDPNKWWCRGSVKLWDQNYYYIYVWKWPVGYEANPPHLRFRRTDLEPQPDTPPPPFPFPTGPVATGPWDMPDPEPLRTVERKRFTKQETTKTTKRTKSTKEDSPKEKSAKNGNAKKGRTKKNKSTRRSPR
jgi:hypothetical protein